MPVERDALMIFVTKGTKSLRHSLVRDVGIASRIQLFVGDLTIMSCTVFSETGLKSQNIGPLYSEKVGGSDSQASILVRICLILSEKKSLKRWGSSDEGKTVGRGVDDDLPSNWEETEKSCLQEGLESIL